MPAVVACVAGDTNHVNSFRYTLENFSRFNQDAVYPYGAGGANASFALIARNYMRTFGARREDFGKIGVAQRSNALRNPACPDEGPLTIDQYMSARPIADPDPFVRLRHAVRRRGGLPGDERGLARSLKLPSAKILSTIERHNAFGDDPVQVRGGWAMDVDELYAMAGVKADVGRSPPDLRRLPRHVMMQFEDLGFCRKGGGADFVRQHDLTIDGSFPHNTSGGQLSVGQAGAGGGYLGSGRGDAATHGQAGRRRRLEMRDRVGVGLWNDQL